MIRRRTLAVPLSSLALLSTLVATAAGTLQTPEQFLGFKVGADNKLARWDKIVEYMKLAAANSDRVRFRELGKTSSGNPFIALEISVAGHAQEPRPLQAARAEAVLPGRRADRRASATRSSGRASWCCSITCSIHATEIGASQMALELVHRLATDDSPAGEEDPRQRDLPAGAEPEPRRPDHGDRLVQQEPRHAVREQPDSVPLSPVRRPRQQPRHVHVHAEGEPVHGAAAVARLVSRRCGSTSTRWAATARASS